MTDSTRVLCDVAMSYFSETAIPKHTDLSTRVQRVIQDFLTNRMPYETARRVLHGLVGSTEPLERLNCILQTSGEPIPSPDSSLSHLSPRKIRPWTAYEDQRLLCGMYRFGIDNWTAISKFVGNRRTRSQCSQRWYRGLDPSIAKSAWTSEEEDRLLALVATIGDRSWTRIASKMGNRSDVQCRYRYKHLQKITNHTRVPPQQKLVLPPLSTLTANLDPIESFLPLARPKSEVKSEKPTGVSEM
jgi:hypothetical protein